MRFSCDNCSAQYMIADDKVGPKGVKVRCKKCGHVVLVKRPPSEEALAPPAPAPPPPTGDVGLDVELGQAFDVMLGDKKPEPEPSPGGEPSATQEIPPEELARLAAGERAGEAQPPVNGAGGGAQEPGDWYVAIRDQQVGPLVPDAVKGRWEAGELGPDSLVWRAGMADWKPLSTVPELAEMLAPIPRRDSRPRTEPAAQPSQANAVATAPAADSSWQPNAGGALAALVTEEMAALSQPEPKHGAPPAPAKTTAGNGSLVASMNLPDSGGVDPTGAIPLPIKGLESTGEAELKRPSSVARSAAEVRVRRTATRTIVIAASAAGLVVLAAVGGLFMYFDRRLASSHPVAAPPVASAPVATAPQPAAVPAPLPPAPAPPAVAFAPPAPAPQPAASSRPPLAEPAPTPPSRTAEEAPARQKRVRPEPVAKPAHKRSQRVAAVEPSGAPPAPEPRAKKSTGDPLLDFAGSSDSDFERELGGGGSGKRRSVYVPPAPGSDLPNEVSQAQIQEGVAGKMAGLRDCLARQEAADPGSHGVLKIRWMIAADGSVSGVRTLTPEFAGQPISKCLSGVVKTIRFPRSRTTGQEVIFPFKF